MSLLLTALSPADFAACPPFRRLCGFSRYQTYDALSNSVHFLLSKQNHCISDYRFGFLLFSGCMPVDVGGDLNTDVIDNFTFEETFRVMNTPLNSVLAVDARKNLVAKPLD